MPDEDFLTLLGQYLEPPAEPNPELANVTVIWVRDEPRVGSLHMWEDHHVSEAEVEQVLLEIPPVVEIKRDPVVPGRTYFWGATRYDRHLFVVCEDWVAGGRRYLRPVTAFQPDQGRAYWEKQ